MTLLKFPDDFFWGSATAAHQVEGENFNNDLWDWEQIPGNIKNNDSSLAANEWAQGRYREDFARAQSLGHNTHRLSVEWSRIEPRDGEWNDDAIKFYREMLADLRARGMTPMVTIHHFTNPKWLAEKGGWENPIVVQRLARFAEYVVRKLGDLCSLWITINEPLVYAYSGYLAGTWPPQKKHLPTTLRVAEHLIRAHAAMYHAIKRAQPDSQIGIAHQIRDFIPSRTRSARDRLVTAVLNRIYNRGILIAIRDGRIPFPLGRGQSISGLRGALDFIGLNYYFSWDVQFDRRRSSELYSRWILEPWAQALEKKLDWFGLGNPKSAGLHRALEELARYQLPIYITENGIFDEGSDIQTRYLVSHLAAVHRAIQSGVRVKGYYWWTLVDNFEWAEGFNLRFGLYHLDVPTQARATRPVAAIYSRIIRENGIADDLMDQYGHAL